MYRFMVENLDIVGVDVGEGKDWWYVHGLTTHDKVYELNRQMCDLGKTMNDPMKPLSEETAQELIGKWEKIGKEWASKKKEIVESIFGNITNEKSNIMEEKKTKKMTKEEAFEWLKGKKVKVCGRETSQKVQSKLFACGVQWMSGSTDFCDYGNYYVINSLGRLGFCDGMSSFWKNLSNEEISADDILSIEIEEECAKDDEDPYFGGRIKDLQEMLEHDEVLIITKTNFLTMTK